MKKLLSILKVYDEIKKNHRLQVGVVVCCGIGFLYIFFALNDEMESRSRELASIRSATKKVLLSSKDPLLVQLRVQNLRRDVLNADLRLGGFASDAIAQAALSEWAVNEFKRNQISSPRISNVTAQSALRSATAESSTLDKNSGELRELRMNVNFPYSPDALLAALSLVEGNARFSYVEGLTVSGQRVDMNIRLLTRVGRQFANYSPEPGIDTSKPSQTTSAKPIEISPPVAASAPVIYNKILW